MPVNGPGGQVTHSQHTVWGDRSHSVPQSQTPEVATSCPSSILSRWPATDLLISTLVSKNGPFFSFFPFFLPSFPFFRVFFYRK